jgi:hypothetical protein
MTRNLEALRIAAALSEPPQKLRHCGPMIKPRETTPIDRLLTGQPVEPGEMIDYLRHFFVADGFYRLIAQANGIHDEYALRVIEAYWFGNELLEEVPVKSVRQLYQDRFARVNPLVGQSLNQRIPKGSVPHHSLHVLSAGPVNPDLKLSNRVINQCLIRPGQVVCCDNDRITVRTFDIRDAGNHRVLVADQQVDLKLPPFLPPPQPGEWVAGHWSVACTKISRQQAEHLQHYTQVNLEANKNRKD